MKQKLIFTNLVGKALDDLIDSLNAPQVVIVADINTAQFVLPILRNDSRYAAEARLITVKAGDANKNLESLTALWKQLSDLNATRSTVVVNLGGGMVSDLGGFAAATYQRGMRCINIPTTVLAAVDASVGGKTGINFNGYKNQLGTFSEPEAAIISSVYFNTLPQQQILSGYAEIIKHALLDDAETVDKVLAFSPIYPLTDTTALLSLIEASVGVKSRIVEADFTEKGLRKTLNFGHTAGHAFESLAMRRSSPVPHGYAVAWGMVVSLVLSHMELQFPSDTLHTVAQYIRKNFGAFDITCDDYPALLDSMHHDKKNARPGQICFTLLESIGHPRIDCVVDDEKIKAALDIYRDLMGI